MALTITIPGGEVQLAGSKIWIKVNSDTITGSHYQVLLKATAENSLIPGSPFSEAIGTSTPGDVWFELSELFWRQLVPTFSYSNNQLHIEHDNLVESIAFDIGETYIDESNIRQENWAELSGDQYKVKILNGFLSENEQNYLTESAVTFYSEFIQGGRFLTTLINGMVVFPSQNLKLWWITAASAQQLLDAKVDYVLADGSTGTISSQVTINPGKISEFNIDVSTLGLPNDEANPLQSFAFYLADGETVASEKFTFNMDDKYYEFQQDVFFLNKYGVVDCLSFTGVPEYGYPIESSFGQRQATPSDTTRQRTRISTDRSGRNTRTLSTGYKSLDEIKAIQHLLESEMVWLTDGNKLMPVNIEKSPELLVDLMNDVHEIEIIFTEAH